MNKFKYNKSRREYLIEMFDETDKQIEFFLEDEYVNWRDAIGGVREFLKELEAKKVDMDTML